jgi:type II secretory pathway pseudopilin PulG
VNRRTRTAFTTIELMIAIGILVILAGMVFVGFKVVGTGGKARATRGTLETAKSLMTEVDVAKGMVYVKNLYVRPPNSATAYYFAFPPLPSQTPANVPAGTPNPPAPTPVAAPADTAGMNGNISEDSFAVGAHETRFKDPAIIRTQMVMARLMAIPANRTAIGQLPANSFLLWPLSASPTVGTIGNALQFQQVQVGPPARYVFNPPLLLDGWGNPIIYVPPAGLSGVNFKNQTPPSGDTAWVVTSIRVRGSYKNGITNPSDPHYGNFEPGAAGFWASAGPDGDFTKGDDNIYSFEGF